MFLSKLVSQDGMELSSNASSPIMMKRDEASKKMSPILKHSGTERNVLSRQASLGLMGSAGNQKEGKQNTPSFVGVLASKRIAKRLTTKLLAGRARSVLSSRMSGMTVQKETTYRMEPIVKFSPAKVLKITERVLEKRLEDVEYDPDVCSTLSRDISDEIKEKVKALNFDRYKIVVLVFIGEKKNQGVTVSSRCTWDDKQDNSATYTHQTAGLYCTVTVFGVYTE